MNFETLVYTTRNEKKTEYMMRIRWTEKGKVHQRTVDPGTASDMGAALELAIKSLTEEGL